MAKQKITISYRFGATKAERDAWDALAEVAKEQGISPYYFKQIFGKTSKRSKVAAEVRRGWQEVIRTYPDGKIDKNAPYVYKAAPYPIGIKKARKRQAEHDIAFYNDFIEFFGISPLEYDDTELQWSPDEIKYFTDNLQALWKFRRGHIKNENMFDFFENLTHDSKTKIENDKFFARHWSDFIAKINEIVTEMRVRHANERKAKEEHTT